MTWTELDYRWAVVLWKGREILCWCPVPKLLLNAQERSVVFNWVYHMNLRWVGTYARVCAVMVISSSNHGDQNDDQKRSSIHQNIVKIVRVMLHQNIKSTKDDCQIWKVRSPNKWKYAYLSWIIYDTTWNLKPVSKEEFQSSAFLGQSVRRFFEIFVLDSSEKLSDRKFPFQPVISKTASAKFKNDLLLINHEPKFFKPWFIQFKQKYV